MTLSVDRNAGSAFIFLNKNYKIDSRHFMNANSILFTHCYSRNSSVFFLAENTCSVHVTVRLPPIDVTATIPSVGAIANFGSTGTTKYLGLHAVPYYINLVFSRRYRWLVILAPRRLKVQVNSNVVDQGKHTIKTSAYQECERMRIMYTRVFEDCGMYFCVEIQDKSGRDHY